MKEQILQIKKQFLEDIKKVKSFSDVEKLKIKYIGKKGIVTQKFKFLKNIPLEERSQVGKLLNDLKDFIIEKIEGFKEKYRGEEREFIDFWFEGRSRDVGVGHVLTKGLNEIIDILVQMGFEEISDIENSPEVEWRYNNFEALNIPLWHPAADMWSTFYIEDEIVLRSHTSPVQIRVMSKRTPPLKIIAPGKVYRPDAFDATHSPVFHQVEGFCVDKNITFADLKWTIEEFVRRYFGSDIKVRFRPSFFPFTEPSVEVLVYFKGKWLEVLGAGMIHPKVFEVVKYPFPEFKGYAFGMGVERLVMIKYGVDDIRLFYENYKKWLKGF